MYEFDPVETLIRERKMLFEKIYEYEVSHILYNCKDELDIVEPSPETRYQMNNEYLKVLTDLIKRNRNLSHMEAFLNVPPFIGKEMPKEE
jgi:hypothetical protein